MPIHNPSSLMYILQERHMKNSFVNRLKHHSNKGRKYGLISSQEDRMELKPLGQEDDEEDLTVFDRTRITSGKSHEQPELMRNGTKTKDKSP